MANDPHDIPHDLVRSTDEARQGVTGHNVRFVLDFGLVGVAITLLGAAILIAI